MLVRSSIVMAALAALMAAIWACVPPLSQNDEQAPACEASCPDDYVEVEHCPAFVGCWEVTECDPALLCAPAEALNNSTGSGFDNARPGSLEELDCDQPMECPDGTVEVEECTDSELCTQLSLCDANIICKELPALCIFRPLCPDGDRHIKDCEHEDCYRHRHCSGPVDCFRCDDQTPTGCPEDMHAVEPEECIGEQLECQEVETCDETLHCTPTPQQECIEQPRCPGDTRVVESCSHNEGCFTISGCDDQVVCQAPNFGCMEKSGCSDGYREVGIDACLEAFEDCQIKMECDRLIACVPQ